jgi:hypothetical protein
MAIIMQLELTATVNEMKHYPPIKHSPTIWVTKIVYSEKGEGSSLGLKFGTGHCDDHI